MSGEITFLASNILQTETQKNYYVILDSIGNLWFYVAWKMWSPSNITSLTWFCLHFFPSANKNSSKIGKLLYSFLSSFLTLIPMWFFFYRKKNIVSTISYRKGEKELGLRMWSHLTCHLNTLPECSSFFSREKKVNLALLVSKLYYSNMFYKRLSLKCSQQ